MGLTNYASLTLRLFVLLQAFTYIGINAAHAGMFSTDQVNTYHSIENDRQSVRMQLQRDDVRQALLAHGVASKHVEQRIDQLTDDEIQQLAQQFDQLPAASGVGLVLFASGPIVLMLELLGYTDLTTTF